MKRAKRKALPKRELQRRLAAQRFNWHDCTTAPAVMDRLLQEDWPLPLDSLRDALLPVCDRLIRELYLDEDEITVEYEYRAPRLWEKRNRGLLLESGTSKPARLIAAWRIGPAFYADDREVQLPSSIIALAYLRGILQSLDRIPQTDLVRMQVCREVSRWFRFAFEIPFVWADGDSRAQSARRGSPQREVRIVEIQDYITAKNQTRNARLKWIEGKYGIQTAQAQRDLREAMKRAGIPTNREKRGKKMYPFHK